MPKVTMSTGGAGPHGSWQPGQTIEATEEQAAQYVAAGSGTVVEEPAPDVDLEAEEFMALSRDELLDLATEHGLAGLASANKTQIAAALRAANVSVPREPETAALGGGETAARTEAPQPRERIASDTSSEESTGAAPDEESPAAE